MAAPRDVPVALRTVRLVRAFRRLAGAVLARLELERRAVLPAAKCGSDPDTGFEQLSSALRSAAADRCAGAVRAGAAGSCLDDPLPHHQSGAAEPDASRRPPHAPDRAVLRARPYGRAGLPLSARLYDVAGAGSAAVPPRGAPAARPGCRRGRGLSMAVLVTGASSGIGRALALHYLD